MWSIGEMKKKGWGTVKQYYWAAFAAAVFFCFLNYNVGIVTDIRGRTNYLSLFGMAVSLEKVWRLPLFLKSNMIWRTAAAVLKIFIINPVEVGIARFYLMSRKRGESAGFGQVIWAFGSGSYLNMVWILFQRDLFIFLWSLLFIIPGIYKEYEYSMMPFLLAENPQSDRKLVFSGTKQMMEGNRLSLFCLYLSFIGWRLLAWLGGIIILRAIIKIWPLFSNIGLSFLFLPGGITIKTPPFHEILINPYIEASVAELYLFLKENRRKEESREEEPGGESEECPVRTEN